ncbi:MAG: PAS domain S-box protein [Nitrospina sp.]|nr:PAS domain S-box protein [Nitrospina sp.]
MVTAVFLSFSIAFQFIAAFLALRLIKITGRRLSWILISSAIILMGIRRSISLLRLLAGDIQYPPDYVAEGVALLISILMLAGIARIHIYFREINKAEKERCQTENLLVRFGRILDNSFNEIYVFNAETFKFTQVNVGACRNLKYSMKELTHLTPLDLKPEFSKETFEELISPLKTGQKPMVIFETLHKRKDETLYPVEIRLQLMKDESPPVFIAIVQNIAKRKNDKEMLMNYARELERSNKELERSNKELERSNKELEEFAFIASHDLQEPLRKITTSGDYLLDKAKNLDKHSRKYINRMQKSAYRMKYFIEDLLSLARVASKPAPFELVNLEKMVKTVCEDMGNLIHSTQGVVNIKNLPAIEGDKNQLYQLFMNIILNALKYKKDDRVPIVNIFGRKENADHWNIIIEDNGIGLDEKYSDKIFQPFKRLHGRSEYEGSGIGLSICKKIVDHHEGTISVKSKPGEGTAFTITLPTNQPADELSSLPIFPKNILPTKPQTF